MAIFLEKAIHPPRTVCYLCIMSIGCLNYFPFWLREQEYQFFVIAYFLLARNHQEELLLCRNVQKSYVSFLLQESLLYHSLRDGENIWQMKFHPKKCTVIIENQHQSLTNDLHLLPDSRPHVGSTCSIKLTNTWASPHLEKRINKTFIQANKTVLSAETYTCITTKPL